VNKFSLSNCVVHNELTFTTKIVLSVASERSLPKLCCPQRINIAAEMVLSATNERLLQKLCCPQ
jgi:hypothetical protein